MKRQVLLLPLVALLLLLTSCSGATGTAKELEPTARQAVSDALHHTQVKLIAIMGVVGSGGKNNQRPSFWAQGRWTYYYNDIQDLKQVHVEITPWGRETTVFDKPPFPIIMKSGIDEFKIDSADVMPKFVEYLKNLPPMPVYQIWLMRTPQKSEPPDRLTGPPAWQIANFRINADTGAVIDAGRTPAMAPGQLPPPGAPPGALPPGGAPPGGGPPGAPPPPPGR